MQNLVDVGRRKGGLRWEGIFRYFFCSILFCILAHSYRSHQKTDHDRLWLKRVFSRKVGPFGGLGDKN